MSPISIDDSDRNLIRTTNNYMVEKNREENTTVTTMNSFSSSNSDGDNNINNNSDILNDDGNVYDDEEEVSDSSHQHDGVVDDESEEDSSTFLAEDEEYDGGNDMTHGDDFVDTTKPKVKVEEKEQKILTSEYTKNVLTEEELKSAKDLVKSFSLFLSNKMDISEDDGIKTTIPTGIDLLDTVMGGGFATSLVQIVGNPGTGKTALACKVLATGQRKFPGKFIGMFVDSEESMTTSRLIQLGVNNPPINPYGDVTVEKVFKMVEGMCIFKEENPVLMDVPFAIVWDSIANTLTEKANITDDVNSVLGEKARVLTHALPKYVKKLNKYKISLVAINQLRDKIQMGPFPTVADLKFLSDRSIPGGKSALFNSVQLLYLKAGKSIKGEYGFDGFLVECRAVKNKLFTPNIDFTLVFSFERGFSNFWTNYELLKKFKRVQSGSWCKLNEYPKVKFRQKDAIRLYREDPDFRQCWDEQVRSVLEEEYIKRFSSTTEDLVEA